MLILDNHGNIITDRLSDNIINKGDLVVREINESVEIYYAKLILRKKTSVVSKNIELVRYTNKHPILEGLIGLPEKFLSIGNSLVPDPRFSNALTPEDEDLFQFTLKNSSVDEFLESHHSEEFRNYLESYNYEFKPKLSNDKVAMMFNKEGDLLKIIRINNHLVMVKDGGLAQDVPSKIEHWLFHAMKVHYYGIRN